MLQISKLKCSSKKLNECVLLYADHLFIHNPERKMYKIVENQTRKQNIILETELWTYTNAQLWACLLWMDLPFCLEREQKRDNGGSGWSSYATRDVRWRRSVVSEWRVGMGRGSSEQRENEQRTNSLVFLSFKVSFSFSRLQLFLFSFLFNFE